MSYCPCCLSEKMEPVDKLSVQQTSPVDFGQDFSLHPNHKSSSQPSPAAHPGQSEINEKRSVQNKLLHIPPLHSSIVCPMSVSVHPAEFFDNVKAGLRTSLAAFWLQVYRCSQTRFNSSKKKTKEKGKDCTRIM